MPGERHEHIVPFGEPTKVRGLDVTLLPAGHIFGSAQFFLESDARQPPLHRRFQAPSRPLRRADRMAASRHADHGNDLRAPPLSLPADGGSGGADRGLRPRDAGRRRRPSPARLLVRQSAGNSLLARRRRSPPHAARLRLPHDAHLRAVRPTVRRIRTLRRRQGGRQSPDLSAQRESLAHAGKNPAQTRGHDQRLGDRSERALPLPDGCRVPALRSRGLHRPGALRRTGATETRADAARFCGRVRARSARTRRGSVGPQRRKPTRALLALALRARARSSAFVP